MDRQHAERVYFQQIKHAISLERVLDHYGLLATLKGRGAKRRGCCPIHDGSSPAQFHVDLDKSVWHCFGDCNRGGGMLEFVAEIERIGIRDAALQIGRWFPIASGNLINQHSKGRRKSMAGERPSHKVFLVEERGEGKESFWHRVGSAWPHSDGKGLTIQLPPGLSVAGRVQLREYTDEDAKEEEQQKSSKRKK